MPAVADTHDTCGFCIRAARRPGGVPDAAQVGKGDLGGYVMKTFALLLADKAGLSSIRLALMIGLASSAMLVVVRIGVAVAGQ